MSDLTIDLAGLDAMTTRYAGALRVVQDELRTAGRESGFLAEASAKAFAPVDQGQLVGSIGSFVDQSPGGFVTTVEATAEHAPHQEFGTGPIVPRRAKILSWVGKDGVRVFARRTRGVPAKRYMQRAFQANRGRIIARHRVAARRIVARLEGGR